MAIDLKLSFVLTGGLTHLSKELHAATRNLAEAQPHQMNVSTQRSLSIFLTARTHFSWKYRVIDGTNGQI
jgi:hypothetical protein